MNKANTTCDRPYAEYAEYASTRRNSLYTESTESADRRETGTESRREKGAISCDYANSFPQSTRPPGL